MKKYILLLWLFISFTSLQAQEFEVVFQQCYGGSDADVPFAIQQQPNGGFVVFAATSSNNGDVSFHHGFTDYWLFETNASGQIVWEKTYGGSGEDVPSGMLQTTDGGFLLFGNTYSYNGDVECNHHPLGVTSDFWVIKTNSIGEITWKRCYGGTHQEWSRQIIFDHEEGSYMLVGTTGSVDGDISHNNGTYDVWVVKIDRDGNIVWENAYGGYSHDSGNAINLTSDGGYIVGATISYNGGNPVNGDLNCREGLPSESATAWLLKLNSIGEIEWQQCYGGTLAEGIVDVMQTPEGGFIFVAFTTSGNGEPNCYYGQPEPQGAWDAWVVKVSKDGSIEWQRCLGGTDWDTPEFIRLLDDGTYLVGGMSKSNNFDLVCNPATNTWSNTAVLHRLSAEGDLLWTKCLGSVVDNYLYCLEIITPDHYLLGASTKVNGIDVNCTLKGNHDVWIVEIRDTTVSINEQKPTNIQPKLIIFPNPATNEVWLQLPANMQQAIMQVELISPTGRLIYTSKAEGEFHKIEFKHLPPGLYLIRLWDGESWLVEKVVKK